MVFGEHGLFSFKNKATIEREQEEYAAWAFPYGQKQRDTLEALLLEVFPKKKAISTVLIPFLTCKELYEGAMAKNGALDKTVTELMKKQKNYSQIIKSKDMCTFIALVIADADVGESCEYPTADEIRASALEIEQKYMKR